MFNNVYMHATDVQYAQMFVQKLLQCHFDKSIMTQYHTGHDVHVWYKNEKYQQPVQLKLNAYADFFH